MPSDQSIRIWGMCLQLVGAATVWLDLTTTARDFGEGFSLRKHWEWFLAGFRRPPAIDVSVQSAQGQSTSFSGFAPTVIQTGLSNEVRIALLESAVKALETDVQTMHTEIDKNKKDLENELKTRATELKQQITEINDRLKTSLVGSLSILSFGVWWLMVGIVLTSIPVEIVTKMHLVRALLVSSF